MGLAFVGTALGVIGMVMALLVGHPVWLALLMLPTLGSGSVMILAASMIILARIQDRRPLRQPRLT